MLVIRLEKPRLWSIPKTRITSRSCSLTHHHHHHRSLVRELRRRLTAGTFYLLPFIVSWERRSRPGVRRENIARAWDGMMDKFFAGSPVSEREGQSQFRAKCVFVDRKRAAGTNQSHSAQECHWQRSSAFSLFYSLPLTLRPLSSFSCLSWFFLSSPLPPPRSRLLSQQSLF